MKVILALFCILSAYEVFAQGDAPPFTQGQKQTTGDVATRIRVPNNQSTKLSSSQALIETGNRNLLANPGFEHQNFATSWTTTGSATISTEASAPLNGNKSLKAVMAANAVQIYQDSTLYAGVLAGTQGVIRFSASNTAPGATCYQRAAGVKLTGANNKVTLTTDGLKRSYEIPIVLSATSNGVECDTGTTAGTLILDDFEISDSLSLPEVSQAQLLGTVSFASDCAWTSTQTGSFANIAADASCTITTTGSVSAPTTGIPAFRVNPMPIGNYVIIQESGRLFLQGGSSDQTSFMRLSNGTSSTATIQWGSQDSGATTTLPYHGNFTYTLSNTSATDQTWQIQQYLSNATSALWNLDNETKFSIYYYPPASKIYSQRCTGFFDCENTFAAQLNTAGGVIDSSTSPAWLSCSATATTLTCTYSTALSNVLTEPMTCTGTKSGSSGGSAILIVQAGSTTGFSATSTNMTSNGTGIVCHKNFPDFKEKSQITGTFREVMTVPGVSKPKTCYYYFGGASATLAAPTECTTGTCVEVYDSCGTGAPPSFTSTGFYSNLTFASGTFATSSPVMCNCTAYDATATTTKDCVPIFETGDQTWSSTSSGGFVTNLITANPAGTVADGYVQVRCEGSAP